MPLSQDTRVLVAYKDYPNFHHERIILEHIHLSWYIIMTPDGDILHGEHGAIGVGLHSQAGHRQAGPQDDPNWN